MSKGYKNYKSLLESNFAGVKDKIKKQRKGNNNGNTKKPRK